MNRLLLLLRKTQNEIALPLLFAALSLSAVYLLQLLPVGQFQTAGADFCQGIGALFGIAFCGVFTYATAKNMQGSFAAAVAFAASDFLLYTLGQRHFSLVLCVLLGWLFCAVIQRFSWLFGFLICMITGILSAVLLYVLDAPAQSALQSLASALGGKGALFGAVSHLWQLIFSDRLETLFYHAQYGGATVVGEKLYTGAVDIFAATPEAPQRSTAQFLTGKYFVNLCLPLGFFTALRGKTEGELGNAFLFTLLPAILFGDTRLFFLCILLYNPALYLASSFLAFLAYLTASLTDIRIGFLNSASLWELLRFGNNYFYFLLCAFLLCVTAYFTAVLVCARFDFAGGRVYPKEVKTLLSALGGERNIGRIQNGILYVVNPNLIDVLRVDCDIRENRVTLQQDDLELLVNYI